MEYGHASVQHAMRAGWSAFVLDATARNMEDKQNEVMESDKYWRAYAQYVRAAIKEQRENAAWQHPTQTQLLWNIGMRDLALHKTRQLMIRVGLRVPPPPRTQNPPTRYVGTAPVVVQGFLF